MLTIAWKINKEYYQSVKILTSLIWFQTVCNSYQQLCHQFIMCYNNAYSYFW